MTSPEMKPTIPEATQAPGSDQITASTMAGLTAPTSTEIEALRDGYSFVKEVFDRTPLAGLGASGERIPYFIAQRPGDDAECTQANLVLSRWVERLIIEGVTPLKRVGKESFSIEFFEYQGSGTGEHAAKLVGAILESQKIPFMIEGNSIRFNAPEHSEALTGFREACNERRENLGRSTI